MHTFLYMYIVWMSIQPAIAKLHTLYVTNRLSLEYLPSVFFANTLHYWNCFSKLLLTLQSEKHFWFQTAKWSFPPGHIPTGHRWDRIAMDILDVCDPTPEGFRYILVIADYFSKWTEAFPMKNKCDIFGYHIWVAVWCGLLLP